MSSKDLLIEQYRGEIKNIRELAKTFAENNIYDENGYVDNTFLLSVLSLMADMTSAELELGRALNKMLGSNLLWMLNGILTSNVPLVVSNGFCLLVMLWDIFKNYKCRNIVEDDGK